MTCVAFNAVREYIVGKTAPVPVKVYDYYEPGGFLHLHTKIILDGKAFELFIIG